MVTKIIICTDEELKELEDFHFSTDLKYLEDLRGIVYFTTFEEEEIEW